MDYSASSPLDKLSHAARAEAAGKGQNTEPIHQNAAAGPSTGNSVSAKPKPSFVVHRPSRTVVRPPEMTSVVPPSSFQLFMPSEPTSPFSTSTSNPSTPLPSSSTTSLILPSLHTGETTSFFPDLHRLSSYSNVHRDLSDVRSLAGESGWASLSGSVREGDGGNRSSGEGEVGWTGGSGRSVRRTSRSSSDGSGLNGSSLSEMGYKGREAPAPPTPTTIAAGNKDSEADSEVSSPPETPTSARPREETIGGADPDPSEPLVPKSTADQGQVPIPSAPDVPQLQASSPDVRIPARPARAQPNLSQTSIATHSTRYTSPSTTTATAIPAQTRPVDMGEHYLSLGIALHQRSGLSSTNSSSTAQAQKSSSSSSSSSSDLSNAALNFKRSMDAGSLGGKIMYGLSLRHGWGMARDESRGFEVLSGACREVVGQKDPVGSVLRRVDKKLSHELVLAIYEVGICFSNGWGVKQDGKKAVSYFRIAAEFGDRDAQEQLGHLYTNGKHGVKKDLAEAAKWYRAAIAQGASSVGLSWIYKDKYAPCC